ncbi:hypothetical protein [Gabonibacter chumensis]|uniref:hypothetical protein n=1 Tax=Gabonibacter chumensis TaxID=2972474 RepID=UPI002573D6A6|nr:hypothetical protein [Gabonibacter chumensis]MCR9010689.1 hypothetical protein [Gabonibacter chumensis]
MKKVLYISAVSEESPGGYRKRSFCSYLKTNSNLTILYLLDEKESRYLKLVRKLIDRTSFLPDSHMLYYFSYRKRIKTLLKSNKFDYVFIQTLPFTLLLFCDLVKRIQPSVKLIVDMSDPIVINANFKRYAYLKRWELKEIEKKCLNKVDYLIVLNKEIEEYYLARVNYGTSIMIIEQGTDYVPCIERLAYTPVLQFVYAGVFYEKLREPYCLYDGIKMHEDHVKLVVCGSFKKKFVPPVEKCFKYMGSISRENIFQLYDRSHVIIFIDNYDSYQIPGKLFEVLASNKAILFIYFNENSPTLRYIDGVEGVFLAHYGKLEIQEAIDKIFNSYHGLYNRNINQYLWVYLLKRLDILFD